VASETQEKAAHGVTLTPEAVTKVRSLLSQEPEQEMRLRLAVESGGCAGLKYSMYFDERTFDGDAIVDFDGVEVVVDRKSGPFVEGAVISFADTITTQGFQIDNPNASGSCACGDSFH
jgi:iron-sulfur cluster assembly accessory protein